MTNTHFLNVHVIRPIPYSNLNRDDVGNPKSLVFGGTERARLSSQALKRAMRVDFEAATDGERTWRSKLADRSLARLVKQRLEDAGVTVSAEMDKEIAHESAKVVKQLTTKDKKAKDSKKEKSKQSNGREPDEEDSAGDTLVWLAEADLFEKAARIAHKVADGSEVPVAFNDDWESRTRSLSIAAFGRMFAANPKVQTEAAVQVAHAFTTHASSTEIDFFTAVDDLRLAESGDAGSGHLDVALFTSGVFYSFLSIDRDQLMANLSDDTKEDRHMLKARLRSLMTSMLLALPSGKTAGTAPQTLPLMILAEEAAQPVSYADAFERPVSADREGGFATESADRLADASRRARAVFSSLFGDRRVLRSDTADSVTFEDLVEFCTDWLVSGE